MRKLVAFFFRVSAIGVKFLFILFLGFYYSLEDVGLYGLVAALAGYSVYLLGFEIHSSVNRQGIKKPEEWVGLIKKQHGVFLVSSIVFAILVLSYAVIFPANQTVILCLLALCLVEYSGQEIYRRYIALRRPFEASIFLFSKNAIWPMLFVSSYFFQDVKPDIEVVFYFWIVFGGVSNLFAGLNLRKTYFKDVLWPVIDLTWFYDSLRTSLVFLCSILVMRSVNVVDRVLVGISDTPDTLGVYVFYTSVAAAVGAVLNFMGAAQSYPALIRSISEKDENRYLKVRRSMLLSTMSMAVIGVLLVPAFFMVLRTYVENSLLNFESELQLFTLVMIGVVMNALNIFFHYILYCHGKDREILISNLLSLLVTMVFLGLIWSFFVVDVIYVAVSVLIFYTSGVVIKYYYGYRLRSAAE
ncbi:hypothetical protein [Halomonas urumqiensis]|nr:hypothetical protein [Halomonas urumqiensis]